eukprot:TRINITY_DN14576_c0_g1_i12.p1 TRINITY_DN14576_c0_g1~~TRINITY_DN14576_c0_g1_i12.p1  ORF type:complete len:408 (-),score=62.44 TRINITY_DN14576_c0_g1_i12:582-1805(-)
MDSSPPCPVSPRGEMSSSDTFKNTIISAVSQLSTAYNLIVIQIVHVIVENQYCGGDKCPAEVTIASTACLVGGVCGELTFGYVGDCLGRPRALQLTMALSIFGALISSFAVPLTDDDRTVFHFLAIARFVLGLGVGGVYPLSATIAAESSDQKSRGTTTAIVFSMQGVAYVLVPLVAAACLGIFGNPGVDAYGGNKGYAWRVPCALGALPGILLIPFKTVSRKQAAGAPPADLAPRPGLWEVLQMRRYWGRIAGCTLGWFLFDIPSYGNSLFEPTVLANVFPPPGNAGVGLTGGIDDNMCWQLLIVALIALPGYYVAMYFMDSIGRRNMQLQGFLIMAILYAILGIFDHQLTQVPSLMLVLYGLTFFFSNFGPNSTTFQLPAESFPPQVSVIYTVIYHHVLGVRYSL